MARSWGTRTFREQLRVLREAHGVFTGTEAGDEDFIKERMREAFGDRVRIEVTLIKPATRLGP